MHLPDGFLDAKTALLSTGAAVAGVGLALRQARTTLEPRQMPMLGLAAAFVFAAQMLNFPVGGGTSGHLLGGVLTAILLGPAAAVLVMTCVLIVQCLVFNDGGLLALGANVFNMAIVNACGGYFVFRLLKRLARMENPRATVFAAAFAGWFGTVLASVTCAGQLALSDQSPWRVAFPAMVLVHIVIGAGEGLATGLITMAVLRARPELLAGADAGAGALRGEQAGGLLPGVEQASCLLHGPGLAGTRAPGAGFLGYGLLIALGLVVFVAPFACPWPDGLEAVAKALGFAGQAAPPLIKGPVSDYRLPFISSMAAATAVAGVIGALLAFIGAYGLARFLAPGLDAAKKDAPSGN
jgi:cobalt/nickel transport system permease protein